MSPSAPHILTISRFYNRPFSPLFTLTLLCRIMLLFRSSATNLKHLLTDCPTLARPSYDNSFLPSDPICLFADITSQVHDFQTPPIMYLKHSSLRKWLHSFVLSLGSNEALHCALCLSGARHSKHEECPD